MNTNDKKPCPKGTIRRRGYIRKPTASHTVRRGSKLFIAKQTKKQVYVRSSCIKDRGLAGKGTATPIGPLRKGDLIKYGYSYRLPDSARHKALEKAVKAYGPLSTYHKLDAIAKLSSRIAPDASKIFMMDRDWVRSRMNGV